MKKTQKATDSAYTTLHQIVQCVPGNMIQTAANEVGIDARGFSATSHVVALLAGQLAHAFSLNEICDSLALREAGLSRIRGVTAPRRNTLSNANRTRNPEIARRLYWKVSDRLGRQDPRFRDPGRHRGFLHRMKRKIHAFDSSTLQLAMSCMDWARHRRRKAAAKMHARIEVSSFIPSMVIVGGAASHDSVKARELCAGVAAGDIVVADRAYTGFGLLGELDAAGITFVMRPKRNMAFKALCTVTEPGGDLVEDAIVAPDERHAGRYAGTLRRVRMRVKVDGKMREMTFLTNNTQWSPRTVAELYKARWAVELLFTELKQTLQLSDFIGTNENAVLWQVWVALLAHLLLHWLRHRSQWGLSFTRLVGIVRSAVWMKRNITETLRIYGTAGPPRRPTPVAEQLYLQGFEPNTSRTVGQHRRNKAPAKA
jgi:hypothetical protein